MLDEMKNYHIASSTMMGQMVISQRWQKPRRSAPFWGAMFALQSFVIL